MASILASVSVELGANISAFKSAMAQARRELRGVVQAAEAMQDVGKTLSTFVTLPLLAAGAGAVKLAGEFQALEKGFAATYKGAEPLGVALAKVSELAKLPGLGLKEALQGATNLQAAGFSADLAARSLAAFGNALATVGKGKADLEGVGTALSQIASKGKISAEEINQLAERVPQIRQAMKAAFGTADTEVLQKMKISATDFVEGVTKELDKLPKVTGGLQNGFENLADASSVSLAKLGASLNTTFNIEGLLGKAADALNGLTTKFQTLSPEAQKTIFVLAGIAAATGPVLVAIGTLGVAIPAIVAGFAALGTAASAAWVAITGPIGLVVLSIAGVTAAAFALRDQFGSFKQAGAAVGVMLINLVTGPLAFLRDSLATLGFPLVSVAVDFLVGKLGQLRDRLTGIVENKVSFGEFFKGQFEIAAANAIKAAEGVDYFSDVVSKVAPLTQAQVDALAKLRAELQLNEKNSIALGAAYDFIGGKSAALESGIKSLVAAGFDPAGRTVQNFVAQLKNIPAAYDQIELRLAKGLTMPETPDFALKVPKVAGLPTTLEKLPGFDTSALAASTEAARQSYEKMSEAQKNAFQRTLEFNTNMGGAIDQLSVSVGPLLANFAGQFADAFGSILVGTASAGDAMTQLFAGITGTLAGFMGTFGQQLVVLGIGKLKLDTLFAAGAAGGPAAIAAGLGLIALSGIAKAVSSSASSSLGGITGGGGSAPTASIPRSNFTPTTAPGAAAGGPTTITHNVVIGASGRDLAGVLTINTDRLGRIVGRPG